VVAVALPPVQPGCTGEVGVVGWSGSSVARDRVDALQAASLALAWWAVPAQAVGKSAVPSTLFSS